jgi:hypothetical protein
LLAIISSDWRIHLLFKSIDLSCCAVVRHRLIASCDWLSENRYLPKTYIQMSVVWQTCCLGIKNSTFSRSSQMGFILVNEYLILFTKTS